MLNLSAIQNGTMQEIPYKWVVFENLLDKQTQTELIKTFPTKHFQEYSGKSHPSLLEEYYAEYTYKDYQFFRRYVFYEKDGKGFQHTADLSEVWQKLLEELLTPDYRSAIEQLSGVNLKNHSLEIRFFRDRPGFWNRPHTDHQLKNVTHILYFNEEWNPEWGGCFQVLNDNQTKSVVKEVIPLPQYSVAIVRCDRSWHMVSPISLNATQDRLSLHMIFWASES
ncbi:2OG-Fe(II) oxygenase family protein [Scytonema sp. NUACC26]|uniref:2OG-Fe(II) oxygenase family protein n=1 Tax=Scytonema sp. NUACC26 TaxID=3140176 RepID=UPI0034DB8CBC